MSQGERVAATGVVKTLMGKSVFIVRTVNVNGRVYTIRNEHGIPTSPQTRERIAQHTAKNAGGL